MIHPARVDIARDFKTFTATLKMLGISQARFAAYIGKDPNTVSRWAVSGVPRYAERVLELLAERKAFSVLPL